MNYLSAVFSLFLLTLILPIDNVNLEKQSLKDLAIVIDDLGNNMKGTDEILNLPIPLTVAIMPFMPTTKKDAELAHKNGHEVIVHMPMEPQRGKKSWLGPGAITSDLSDEEVRQRVLDAFTDVPHAVGMNNHMGSKITEDERIMKIVLEVCQENGKFYLDSKTSSKSVVKKLANEMNIPYLENNLFFDEVYSVSHIKNQAKLLARNITFFDQFIAIGHVGTSGEMIYEVLNEYIPAYKEVANFVTLTELVPELQLVK